MSWQRQTLHYGHKHGDRYSVLIFDNRGMGGSSKPVMRYKTSEMARDAAELLDHVGWTAPRSVHVVGISMGGMISQELACVVPERVCSLNLLSTSGTVENVVSFTEYMTSRVVMFLPRSFDATVKYTAGLILTPAYLVAADNSTPPDASTPRVKMPPGGGGYLMFGTNYERFAAQEIHKHDDKMGWTKIGFMMQVFAAGWHRKTPEQLAEMAERVGRERIMVVHGTADNMLQVEHGRRLIKHVNPGVAHIVEGMGHAPVIERTDWLHDLLEKRFAACEELSGR